MKSEEAMLRVSATKAEIKEVEARTQLISEQARELRIRNDRAEGIQNATRY